MTTEVRRRFLRLVWITAALVISSVPVCAQPPGNEAAGATHIQDDTQLKQVIIFGRHGVRSPIAPNSYLDNFATRPYPVFSVAPGILTANGATLETTLGSDYRLWLTRERLLTGNDSADARVVDCRSNVLQRTIATAKAFAAGMLPAASVHVNHDSPTQSDPLFDEVGAGIARLDQRTGIAAVRGRLGGHPQSLTSADPPELALTRSLIAPASMSLGAGCCAASARGYGNVYFFGDSDVDSGSYVGTLQSGVPVWGKYTEPGGAHWTENVGAVLGFDVTPFFSASAASLTPDYAINPTGNNAAIGGARTDLLPGNVVTTALPASSQVSRLINASGGSLNSSALYFYRAGFNDIYLVDSSFNRLATPTSVTLAGEAVVPALQALKNAGARYLIYVNSGEPEAIETGDLTDTFNQAVNRSIIQSGLPVLQVDLNGLTRHVFLNSALYGFLDNSSFACASPIAVAPFCTSLITPTAGSQYMWADIYQHASSGLQRIQSDYIMSLLRAPQQAALLGEVPLTFSQQANDLAAGRQRLFFDDRAPRDGNNLYLAVSYSRVSYDPVYGMKDKAVDGSTSFTIGYDRAFSEFQVGVALSSHDVAPNIDFGGMVRTQGWLGAAYGTLPLGNSYVGGVLAYGAYNQSIDRVIPLGISNRQECGSTDATQTSAQLNAGYLFRGENWYHGPRAEFTYGRVNIDAFDEDSGTFSALRYGAQARDSRLASLGYLGSMRLPGTAWHLNGSLAYAKELEDADRFVTIGVMTTVGDLPLPVGRNTKGYWTSGIGASGEVAKHLLLSGQIDARFNDSGLSSSAHLALNWIGW
jgi:outer membrane lipase/esterase